MENIVLVTVHCFRFCHEWTSEINAQDFVCYYESLINTFVILVAHLLKFNVHAKSKMNFLLLQRQTIQYSALISINQIIHLEIA